MEYYAEKLSLAYTKYSAPLHYFFRIKVLPPLVFENLNSLETLNLQNNKLQHISEEVTENIVDTLRHIDITGNIYSFLIVK